MQEIPSQFLDSRLFSRLFDELGEAVLISDDTGRIVGANDSAVQILGMPIRQLKSLTHHDPIWQAILEDGSPVPIDELPAPKALHTGQAVTNMELGIVRADGTLVWILESAAPIYDAIGRLTGVVATFRDISQAIQLRQELRDLNQKYLRERDRANAANKLKSTFLANMSHEIRTPMTAILGFSEVLMGELKGQLSEHHATFLQSIMVSGRRLLTLLNDILDLSKIEAGHVEVRKSELEVNAEVDAWVSPLIWGAKQKALSVNLELDSDPLIIQADRQRFGQILTNIVSNAIKFTARGTVTVRTSVRRSRGNITFAAIEVEDTGAGIPIDFLPNLFEEFRQGHNKEYGGTGLGLAISKRLITKMGGTIEVRSQEGTGSIFTILFPLVAVGRAPVILTEDEEHAPPPTEIVKQEALPNGSIILVVEDNVETQRLLAAYLRDHHRLVFAQNAEEALSAIEREVPAIILMDINLPGRDGLSITRDIRAGARCPSVPIIALTAFAMAGDQQKFIEAGCTAYLSKPATRREVLETVNTYVQEPPAKKIPLSSEKISSERGQELPRERVL
ncbi:MAG TPA: ATP-binding protein [Candidatus Kapabacteria bacterium]